MVCGPQSKSSLIEVFGFEWYETRVLVRNNIKNACVYVSFIVISSKDFHSRFNSYHNREDLYMRHITQWEEIMFVHLRSCFRKFTNLLVFQSESRRVGGELPH